MRLYLLKKNMIYNICGCPKKLFIPTNDFEAFDFYKDYKFVYNKQFVASSQNLENGNKGKQPSKYPVIIRPITNLYGMGVGTRLSNDVINMNDSDFWVEFLKGEHISVDIFINDNTFKTIVFRGYPSKLFTFSHWEYLPNYKLDKNIISWIRKHLHNFKGVCNVEVICNKIIECHLRMGDINYFQSEELINAVINCHLNKEITIPKLNKIYLVPVFAKKGKYKRLSKEQIYTVVRKFGIDNVLNYFIDPPCENNPIGGDRVCNFTVTDLNIGFKIRNYIINNYI